MLLIRLVFLFESMVRFSLGPHPACRHADRTISSPMKIGVWRVVSEDSDNFSSLLFVIHGFGDLDDLDQPTISEINTRLNQPYTFRKLQEVALLGSSQRILVEQRNNGFHQILPCPNTVPIHMFFVVVVPPIDIDGANSKKLHEQVETVDAGRALSHRKLMCHLEAGFIPSPIVSMRLTNEVD